MEIGKVKPGETIVFIDDDQDTLDLLSRYFENVGYLTFEYLDAVQAYEDISTAKVKCDVVVTDLSLPNISGIEFTKRLKEFDSRIPIILITATKKVETAIAAIHAGAYDFILKPIHFSQLLLSVERALYLSRIEHDNKTLKKVIMLKENPISVSGVIGKSSALREILALARRVSSSRANVLITGDSGTGKEVIAKAIHSLGIRKNLPFVAINCSAIPENLLESELFGHAKGAFTGAIDKKIGLFEEAGDGTLFLDEIGDLSTQLQAKLLRVLQERRIRRVGENQDRPIQARIISATHRDLAADVVTKKFREDLFYRLNVIPIWISPLRERKDDILPLADFFLKKFSALNGYSHKKFSKEALATLMDYQWPGNVRELENSIERALVLSDGDIIQIGNLGLTSDTSTQQKVPKGLIAFNFDGSTEGKRVLSVEELINQYVSYVLELNNGVKEKTAKDLNIDRKTLYRRLREIDDAAISIQ